MTLIKREFPMEEWKHGEENWKVGINKKGKNWQNLTNEKGDWKAWGQNEDYKIAVAHTKAWISLGCLLFK